jgi:hypothetical protein
MAYDSFLVFPLACHPYVAYRWQIFRHAEESTILTPDDGLID